MSGLMSWMIPYKLAVDDRVPLFSVNVAGAQYGFYMLSIVFWAETLALFVVMAALSASVGAITYKFIIQKQGTPLSYLLGYGVIMPFWLACPYYAIELFDLRNKFMKFCFGAVMPLLGLLNTTEAMYGCVPSYLTTSLGAYARYCGSPMILQYNQKEKKYIKATWLDFANHIKWFVIYLFTVGTIQSFALPSHYQPFGSFEDQAWHDPSRIVHPAQIGNNLVTGILLQTTIAMACEGLIVATVLLTGYKCETVMENPIFGATSPSEFWGKRWNRVVHSKLKRGVYIPLRKHAVPRALAAGGAFLCSGLVHEWLLTFVLRPLPSELGPDGSCESPLCYITPLGGATSFFLWNTIIIMLEYAIGGSKLVAQFVKAVPTPLRTVMLVMLALPIAHWFSEPYVMSNFFKHSELSLPLIKEIVAV